MSAKIPEGGGEGFTFWPTDYSILRAWRLQEAFPRSIYCRLEIWRTRRAAKYKRHLLSCLMTVHHCLFLRLDHSWIHGEIVEIYNPKMKLAICFLSTLPSMGEWSHSCCDVGNCQYQLNIIFAFSQH